MENLINAILNMFSGLTNLTYGSYILIFIISMIPILEFKRWNTGTLYLI